ncbi:hypothetical protein GYMLUDRAFT_64620 [Collybiopsis luxurians FD-317 M1]|uniref:Uncharacterized protein n=1 Tax=Collybiopsis luxurians FD-317 M1 TaxID=944289 RepID=A0A0D0BQC4_9AGAR|nr:hypothetical protein GYMLUDRAFT_64620 [Collybiopsis luxurians FD-317 M1]
MVSFATSDEHGRTMPAFAGDFGSGDIVEVIFNVAVTPNFANKWSFDLRLELKALLLFDSRHCKLSAPSHDSVNPHSTKKRMAATGEIQFSKLNCSLKEFHLSTNMNVTN